LDHGIAQHAAGCRDASCQLRRTNGCRFPRPYDEARSAVFTGVQFDADSSVLGDLAGSEFDTVWHWDVLLYSVRSRPRWCYRTAGAPQTRPVCQWAVEIDLGLSTPSRNFGI